MATANAQRSTSKPPSARLRRGRRSTSNDSVICEIRAICGSFLAGLFRDFHAELFNEKGPTIGGFLDNYSGGFAGAVSGFGLDPDHDWSVATLRGLQCRREFE